jgi:hypothetical protein
VLEPAIRNLSRPASEPLKITRSAGDWRKGVFLLNAVPDAFEIFYNEIRNFVRDK